MAGLDATGLTIKRLEDLRADMGSRLKVELGSEARTEPDSVLGHMIGVVAISLSEVWQLTQYLYESFDPDAANGELLDNVVGIIGVTRDPATKASGTVTLYGSDSTVVPAGSLVGSTLNDDVSLETQTTVTIGASVSGEVDVDVLAEEAGALVVLAGEADKILTPVSGWSSVSNAADLNAGLDVESDAALRLRAQRSLQIIGAGTDNAIRSRVEDLDDVTDCLVVSNRTMATVDGIPAKAFHTIIWPDSGVDEDEVAATIFIAMPAGIEPHGSVSKTVTDAQGQSQLVKFSYATAVPIGVEIDLTVNSLFPADGADQVAAAVLAMAATDYVIAADVRTMAIVCATNSVEGIESMVLRLDKKSVADPPVGIVNIVIDDDEIAVLDSSDLTVSVV
jgi:uncharacterized phage protein gp47/JayE